MNTVAWFLFIFLIKLCEATLKDYEYEKMPPIFHLDDFDQCMAVSDNTLYCFVNIKILPKDIKRPSSVWNTIEKLRQHPANYHHDYLRHGICIPNSCPNIQKSTYTIGNGSAELQKGIVNYYNTKYYNMGLKSEIMSMHCQRNESQYEVDVFDAFYRYFQYILILLLLFGTYCESLYNKGVLNNSINNKRIEFLRCFAIQKNFKSLLSIRNSPDNFAFIEGVRVFVMFAVVGGHTFMSVFGGPITDTKAQEVATDDPMMMPLVNGALLVQTNYLLSGFLLSYALFRAYESTQTVEVGHMIKIFIRRYLRVTPLMMICIWYHATLLKHVSNGPVWHRTVEEVENCRSNWWINMLYLHNYIKPDTMCLPHTWYIASDMQLFVVSLLVMYFAVKYKRWSGEILGCSVIIGLLIPMIDGYMSNLDIILRSYPENAYELMVKTKEWHRLAIPGHANIGCYMQGLGFGYIVYKYRNRKLNINKGISYLWTALSVVAPIVSIYIVYFIYQGYEYSRLEAGLFNSLDRNLFGFGVGLMLLSLTFGHGTVKNILEWEPFQVLGKLSLCVYLYHGTHMRIRMGMVRNPVIATADIMINRAAGDILMSYIVATIITLFIEMPVTNLNKLFLEAKPENRYSDTNKLKTK